MFPKSNLSLTQPGSFIFSKEKPVTISLENFLLITFYSPSSSSTGVIIQEAFEHRADFLKKLDTLFEKYSSLPDVDPNRIRSKIFGANSKFTPLLTALKAWLERHQIPVLVTDLGRTITSEVVLDPKTGRLGVQSQNSTNFKRSVFLTEGTARDRNPDSIVQIQALVLSHNPNVRALAKQAIEEQRHWEATCPDQIDFNLLKAQLSEEKWFSLIVSDELLTHRDLVPFLKEISKTHPKLLIHWIGAEVPKTLRDIKGLKVLPPLEPFLIAQFKKSLNKALMDSQFSSTSETLSFAKKTKTK